MLKFRSIIVLITVSFLFSCGPSKLEQTVVEGKRKLEERQEQDRIKAQVESEAAERRWQQALAEVNANRNRAELSRQQAHYVTNYCIRMTENVNRRITTPSGSRILLKHNSENRIDF